MSVHGGSRVTQPQRFPVDSTVAHKQLQLQLLTVQELLHSVLPATVNSVVCFFVIIMSHFAEYDVS